VSECISHALVTRAGPEGVGEGRVEKGGGVRGCKVSRRSVRGYQAASDVQPRLFTVDSNVSLVELGAKMTIRVGCFTHTFWMTPGGAPHA
jgi:hypothetical protein